MKKLSINTELQSYDNDCELCTTTSSKGTLNALNLTQFISKKTLRGRKEKSPLPKGKKKCSICLEYEEYSKDKLISCQICKCIFHIKCYHIKLNEKEINSSIICERCMNSEKENIPLNLYKCFICRCSDGVLCKNKNNNLYYHYLCYRLLPELYEESENESEISKEKIRKWRYKSSCKYCNEHISKEKVVIKCNNTKCKNYYHIPCAIQKGMLFSINYLYKYYCFDEFKDKISVPFFCASHNKRPAHAYRLNVINNLNFDPDNIKCDEIIIYPKKSNNKIRIYLDDEQLENKNNNQIVNYEHNNINYFKSFDENPDFINNKISFGEGLFEKYYENDNESIFDFYQNDEEEHLFFRNCNNL